MTLTKIFHDFERFLSDFSESGALELSHDEFIKSAAFS